MTDDLQSLTDHLFRQESAKMVAVLTSRLGPSNLQLAEDIVQDTLFKALQTWKIKGIPSDHKAWLYRVARNRMVDLLRKRKFEQSLDPFLASEYTIAASAAYSWEEDGIKDKLLSMMYICAHPGMSEEARICLILKNLCGLSVAEIASALLTGEETIAKRLQRARQFLKEARVNFDLPKSEELPERTGTVLNAIYLLFNEGYRSSRDKVLIRTDLIREAIVLCRMILEDRRTSCPEAMALMSLICFHVARENARLGKDGSVILLEDQDRNLWDRALISEGIRFLNSASTGKDVSVYHLEAAIAYEHCISASLDETNWKNILSYYDSLCVHSANHIVLLNRCIVFSKVYGQAAAREELSKYESFLEVYDLFHHFRGTLFEGLGDLSSAKNAYQKASELARSMTEKEIVNQRLAKLSHIL